MKRILSIIRLKCPRCSKGDLFDKKGLFLYSKMLGMPEGCSHCKQKYEIEPGFWLGSLWTSYPLIVIIELPFLIGALITETINPFWFFGAMVISFFITFPLLLRLGRSIWIHINIRGEKNF